MKNLFLLLAITIPASVFAQPVVIDGSNAPEPGFSGTLSVAVTLDPGPAGPDQVWNFSSLAFIPVGAIIVTDPAVTPMAASFPSSNLCFSVTGTYSFFKLAADKMEVQAYTITAAGEPGDYSPNPRTMMTFPFNYLDEFTDTWQMVGESPNTVTTTYDAYGTLIMPGATHGNVVRIAEDYGGGEVDYQWFSLDPFMFLLVYSSSENQLFYSGIETVPVSVEQMDEKLMQVYPNPANETVCFQLEQELTERNVAVNLYNVEGQHVMHSALNLGSECLDVQHLLPGNYIYQIESNHAVVTTGSVVIE